MNLFVHRKLFHSRARHIIVKILLTMKIMAVLLTAFCLHASAAGYAQTVTISAKKAPLERVFAEIEKQTGYGFVYRWELLQKTKPVDLQLNQASLKDALDICFMNQPLSYSIVDKTIIVSKKENEQITLLTAPLIDVKGKVTNEKGEPVAGASIRVKETNKGTSTDENGVFALSGVDAEATLVISGINIETIEVKLDGKTDLQTLAVKTKITEGEQVVISNGYTKTTAERFVGSYSQLSNVAYERRAGMDIISRLDGTVTGFLFDKKSSSDQLGTIQIRGISTITGIGLSQSASSAPLIIVDNFPFKQDLNTLNPNDVENITVLKDAAATSIWGAQAGNGVIVITTKKGKYNQPLQVSISSNITMQEKPDQYYYPQMSIPDFINAEIFLYRNGQYDASLNNRSSWPAVSPVVEILAMRKSGKISGLDSTAQIDALKSMDLRRDLDKYAYRNAIFQQHYINLSGGNSSFNYTFSGGYNRNLNNVQNSRPDDQFTINTQTGFRPIKNLEIITGISYSQAMQRSASFSLPGKIYPYAQLADAQGHPLAVPNHRRVAYLDTVGGGELFDWKYRPLEEPGLTDRKDLNRFLMLNINVSYRFANWISGTISYQYRNETSDNSNYYSPETYFTRDLINTYTNLSQTNPDLLHPVPVGSILDLQHSKSTSQNARGQLNFHKSFGIRHELSAMAATEISETTGANDFNRFYAYNNDFGTYKSTIDYLTPFPLYGGASGSSRVPNGSISSPQVYSRFVSFISNASYTYNGRYSIYASARKDGSNVFGVNTNRKWKPLWSAGASWDISKEGFYNIKNWFSSLRFRASYGYSGNPGNASGLPTITFGSTLSPLANLTAAFPNDPPNPDLKWEKVKIVNEALDFSLFNNRLSGSIDVYQKTSSDIISQSPLAPSTGNLSFVINLASLKGNGFEIGLNSKNIDRKFKWQTSFGLSYSKTIVTKLYNGKYTAQDFTLYGLNPAEGKIAYGMSSYRWEGLDPLTGDPRGYFNKQVSTNYNAIFNDSVTNQVFHGSAIPLYFGFIGNSFSWKNFTLSSNITYRLDFYFRKPTISYNDLATTWQGNADYALRWQKPGDEKLTTVPSFPNLLNSDRDNFYKFSEVNVLRGDNIRLNDVRLQYLLDNKIWKKMPFKCLQLFVYVNNLNLILWRKNKSAMDPDFVGGSAFIAPTPKTWTGGFSLNF
ncbi:MAG: SusC/RagA family TonB-linked outer membrane protein [Bacteroidota bacterium]|nr:SusC/RagA family TonB-linked outer membrane protein [Bacteroidota bacterium]